MAVVNFRISEEMKRKLAGLAKATGSSQTEMVKSAVAEKMTIHEIARAESSANVPSWVPEGKYVALVRGAVAAVGDSVAEVVSAALTKFPDEAIHVARKGKSIKTIQYAFLAQTEIKCWKYVTVDQQSYPIIPVTIIGTKKMVAASSPDTAASLTLMSPQIVEGAGLRPATEETVTTAAGTVKMNTFKATIELPVGRYDATVASIEIPKTLPFQILLGRNILDLIDLYALGKSKVICVKDP
ncbi:MAG: aspartyl protease family protein [Candidatus Bathyarchaeia archaeon]|jgi:predicted aspartyl protease/predicted DNA-binding protein